MLVTLYSVPVAEISRRHSLSVELYTDDSQLNVALRSAQLMETVSPMEGCVTKMRSWLADHKTEDE